MQLSESFGVCKMERIATQKLVEWKNNKHRKPLIVWGARQVGKTYFLRDIFAKTYYRNNYIYIDCKIEDEVSISFSLLWQEISRRENIS